MGRRRKARELALKILYAYDVKGSSDIKECINGFWSIYPNCPEDIKEYARLLVIGTIERIKKIDNIIIGYIKNWKIERLALVDKNILRLATYELLFEALDEKIIINEAIEIAKKYGDAESYQFINAILDAVSKKCKGMSSKIMKVNSK